MLLYELPCQVRLNVVSWVLILFDFDLSARCECIISRQPRAASLLALWVVLLCLDSAGQSPWCDCLHSVACSAR